MIISKIMQAESKTQFFKNQTTHFMLVLNAVLALLYFYVITFLFPRGNMYLFAALIVGEVYHLWQVLTFIFTIWDTERMPVVNEPVYPPVDIFIPVAGEPVEVVEKTVAAAKAMKYPELRIFVLNDGYVAQKENWEDIETMALRQDVACITRKKPGGAKAGNINNALMFSRNPFVVIFDADHSPNPEFLKKTMPYFTDPKVGFVQCPQFYGNASKNYVTQGAWGQQRLFFGPICKGKNRFDSVTMCGTNMVIRRSALIDVGGMCDTNIAEDFVTGLFLHERGWKSVYVPEVLSEGLAPEDFVSYCKQQHRWARGSLEVIFIFNPLFRKGLTIAQKIQYLASASYYLSGIVVIMNAILPLFFLFLGLSPFQVSTMTLSAIFLPYIFVTIYTLELASNYTYTFRALAFSVSSWHLHLKALFQVLIRQKTTFAVTAKKAKVENEKIDSLKNILPHLIYIAVVIFAIPFAFLREGLTPSVLTNSAWALFHAVVFLPFIAAGFSAFLPERGTSDVKGKKAFAYKNI